MIQTIDELDQQNLAILLYSTGASGEFIASAMIQSIPVFAKTQESWISPNRKTFADALGKTLNGGWHYINNSDVVRRFNEYLTHCDSQPTSKHLILSHPDSASIRFIQQYLPSTPVIEITTRTARSIKFRNLSRNKVNYQDYVTGGDNATNQALSPEQYQKFQNDSSLDPRASGYSALQHLYLEWEKLLITDTTLSFAQLCDFLQCQGSVDTFVSMTQEYLDRNQDILDQIDA